MRVDISLANGQELALAITRNAAQVEAMGFDGLWISEHVIASRQFQKRNYGTYWLEALSSLAHVAALTRTIRLGTSVLVIPYRHPILAAKAIATIDQLSKGRIDLGVGTGWSGEEFNALGLSAQYPLRGEVTNEALDVMQACWKGGTVNWTGKHFNFRDIVFEPVPAQRKIPIWVGGIKALPGPLARIARFGDVWHATGLTPAQVGSMGEKIDATAGRRVPRSAGIFLPSDTPRQKLLDEIAQYHAAGCIQVRVEFKSTGLKAFLDACESLATGLNQMHAL